MNERTNENLRFYYTVEKYNEQIGWRIYHSKCLQIYRIHIFNDPKVKKSKEANERTEEKKISDFYE